MRRESVDRSKSDETETALMRLRRLFVESPVPENPIQSARPMLPVEQDAWISLQATVDPASVAAGDIACLLAFAGVDYAQNVRAILNACNVETATLSTNPAHCQFSATRATLVHTSGHVARLYTMRPDPLLLYWMLDQTPNGSKQAAAHNAALLSIFDGHPSALLRAMVGSRTRTARLAEALRDAIDQLPDSMVIDAFMQRLRRCVHDRNFRVRKAALSVLIQLRNGCVGKGVLAKIRRKPARPAFSAIVTHGRSTDASAPSPRTISSQWRARAVERSSFNINTIADAESAGTTTAGTFGDQRRDSMSAKSRNTAHFFQSSKISQSILRFLSALVLCALLSSGMVNASSRAEGIRPDMIPGRSYVHYTTNHVLTNAGSAVELQASTNDEGHVFDIYGNQVVYNLDGTISDVNQVVVGFVYSTGQ